MGFREIRGPTPAALIEKIVARELAVAIWYLMMGRWTPIEEIYQRLKSGREYHLDTKTHAAT